MQDLYILPILRVVEDIEVLLQIVVFLLVVLIIIQTIRLFKKK